MESGWLPVFEQEKSPRHLLTAERCFSLLSFSLLHFSILCPRHVLHAKASRDHRHGGGGLANRCCLWLFARPAAPHFLFYFRGFSNFVQGTRRGEDRRFEEEKPAKVPPQKMLLGYLQQVNSAVMEVSLFGSGGRGF